MPKVPPRGRFGEVATRRGLQHQPLPGLIQASRIGCHLTKANN
jgi:hypothetical protein